MSRMDIEPPRQPEATLALIALVCGVLGLLGDLVTPLVGMVVGAFGVTTGLRGRQGNVRQNMALTGAVLGGLAVLIGLVLVFVGPVGPSPGA